MEQDQIENQSGHQSGGRRGQGYSFLPRSGALEALPRAGTRPAGRCCRPLAGPPAGSDNQGCEGSATTIRKEKQN